MLNIKNLQQVIISAPSNKYIPLNSNLMVKNARLCIKLSNNKYRVSWTGLCLLETDNNRILKWNKTYNEYYLTQKYKFANKNVKYNTLVPSNFWFHTFNIHEHELVPESNHKNINDYFESSNASIAYAKLTKHWIKIRDYYLS